MIINKYHKISISMPEINDRLLIFIYDKHNSYNRPILKTVFSKIHINNRIKLTEKDFLKNWKDYINACDDNSLIIINKCIYSIDSQQISTWKNIFKELKYRQNITLILSISKTNIKDRLANNIIDFKQIYPQNTGCIKPNQINTLTRLFAVDIPKQTKKTPVFNLNFYSKDSVVNNTKPEKKSVLIVPLSTLNGPLINNEYTVNSSHAENLETFFSYGQLAAIPKYLRKSKDMDIEKIILLASNHVSDSKQGKIVNIYHDDKELEVKKTISALDLFKIECNAFFNNKPDISDSSDFFTVVDIDLESSKKEDDPTQIYTEAIKQVIEEINILSKNNNDLKISVIGSGGYRDVSVLLIETIRLLKIYNIEIDSIINTNKTFMNKTAKFFINDVTNVYNISDLVSGMDSFIRYGRADLIKQYYNDVIKPKTVGSSNLERLIDSLIEIDHAISISNIPSMEKAIVNISELKTATTEESTTPTLSDSIYSILLDGIMNSFEPILDKGEIDYLELIKWCYQKDFIQQALTIIENKMPGYMLKKGFFSFKLTIELKNSQESPIIWEVDKNNTNNRCYPQYKSLYKEPILIGQPYDPLINRLLYNIAPYSNDKKIIPINATYSAGKKINLPNYNDIKKKHQEFHKNIENGYINVLSSINNHQLIELIKIFNSECCYLKENKPCKSEYDKKIDTIRIEGDYYSDKENLLCRILFIQSELKTIRNQCAHANETKERIDFDVIKQLIQIYTDIFSDLLK